MSVSLGMNGFGRIGRYLLRLLADSEDIRITAINARADNASLAHLFKYDSVYGIFPGTVDHDDNGIITNGRHIEVTRCKTGEWEWARLGIDIAVETTGTLKKREDAAQHLQCGAKKVVVSAPCKEADATIVMGVNDGIYDAAAHTVISAASCTTNCLAPVAKVLNDAFGIRHGLMTTIHSYTMSQRILDGSHKDLRRARAACVSMIPTSTGAAKALALVVPELKGKLDGMAVRVPTPDISLVDLTCELEKPATAEEINAALKAAHDGALHDNMGYCDEPLVSIDFKGSTYGGVVDALSTQVMDGTMAKLIIWYDNESGFTNQLARLLRKPVRLPHSNGYDKDGPRGPSFFHARRPGILRGKGPAANTGGASPFASHPRRVLSARIRDRGGARAVCHSLHPEKRGGSSPSRKGAPAVAAVRPGSRRGRGAAPCPCWHMCGKGRQGTRPGGRNHSALRTFQLMESWGRHGKTGGTPPIAKGASR